MENMDKQRGKRWRKNPRKYQRKLPNPTCNRGY